MERRYLWSPVWARDPEDPKCEPTVVGLPHALEDVACKECREDMVVSHVEVLSTWTELASELLEETARRDDPRRDEIARVLVFFAGDLGRALAPGGIITAGCEPELVLMAMAAITEAMVVASACLAQSFSKQLASTE